MHHKVMECGKYKKYKKIKRLFFKILHVCESFSYCLFTLHITIGQTTQDGGRGWPSTGCGERRNAGPPPTLFR